MQNLQPRQTRHARNGIAAHAFAHAAMLNINGIAFLRGGYKIRIAGAVVQREIIERRIRKDNAPTKGIVGPVAFDDGDFVRGILLFQKEGKIQPRRSSAEDIYFHNFLSLREIARIGARANRFYHELEFCGETKKFFTL